MSGQTMKQQEAINPPSESEATITKNTSSLLK